MKKRGRWRRFACFTMSVTKKAPAVRKRPGAVADTGSDGVSEGDDIRVVGVGGLGPMRVTHTGTTGIAASAPPTAKLVGSLL